jgi:DHA1 family tetracycline resistance protein-like MFS transporter
MEKFSWTTKEVGISLAVVGVCFGLVQGAFTGKIVEKLGQKNAAKFGLFLSIFVLMGLGLINQGWMMYAIILPYAFTIEKLLDRRESVYTCNQHFVF